MQYSECYICKGCSSSGSVSVLCSSLSVDEDVSIDAFNDCAALTGFFFKFIEKQVVAAVGKMTPGDTCEIASLLDLFLWDYFGEEGKKAVFRCVDCLILEGLPLIRAHTQDKGYPRFVRGL
jgi:hypothetical protein